MTSNQSLYGPVKPYLPFLPFLEVHGALVVPVPQRNLKSGARVVVFLMRRKRYLVLQHRRPLRAVPECPAGQACLQISTLPKVAKWGWEACLELQWVLVALVVLSFLAVQ